MTCGRIRLFTERGRHSCHGADAWHFGHGLADLQQLLHSARLQFHIWHAAGDGPALNVIRPGEVQFEREQVGGIELQVTCHQLQEAPREQSGADEQDERDGDLRGDQALSEPRLNRRFGRAMVAWTGG